LSFSNITMGRSSRILMRLPLAGFYGAPAIGARRDDSAHCLAPGESSHQRILDLQKQNDGYVNEESHVCLLVLDADARHRSVVSAAEALSVASSVRRATTFHC
jgi:hypothetical protein